MSERTCLSCWSCEWRVFAVESERMFIFPAYGPHSNSMLRPGYQVVSAILQIYEHGSYRTGNFAVKSIVVPQPFLNGTFVRSRFRTYRPSFFSITASILVTGIFKMLRLRATRPFPTDNLSLSLYRGNTSELENSSSSHKSVRLNSCLTSPFQLFACKTTALFDQMISPLSV